MQTIQFNAETKTMAKENAMKRNPKTCSTEQNAKTKTKANTQGLISLKIEQPKPPSGRASEWRPRCGNQMLLVIFHP